MTSEGRVITCSGTFNPLFGFLSAEENVFDKENFAMVELVFLAGSAFGLPKETSTPLMQDTHQS